MVNAGLCEVYNVVSFSLIDLMNDYATSAMTFCSAETFSDANTVYIPSILRDSLNIKDPAISC